DGDAVEESVAATVNAVSVDGTRALGPWRLVRDPAASPAGWTTAEVLPPGVWKVGVDVGFPALGHGELDVAVPVVDPAPTRAAPPGTGPATVPPVAGPSAAGPSSPVASAPASPSSPLATSPQDGDPTTGSSGQAVWWTTAGVAVTALAGAAAGVLIRRRRIRRGGCR
ncbi:LPXTG cell wall anchor domain-containing protein, partial [Streptomyces sp. NPDC055254]